MMATAASVPLLVFEAADCLMAIPASEVSHLEKRGRVQFSEEPRENCTRPLFSEAAFDLGEYFGGSVSDGPWLQWTRKTRNASLRVQRVVDVVSIALSSLAPMPALLRGQRRTCAFLAAGVAGQDVFLLLDPARLGSDTLNVPTVGRVQSDNGRARSKGTTVGRDFSRAKTE